MITALERKAQTLEYPEGDGLPMAETGFHVTLIAYFLAMLRTFFESRPDVYMGANMFLYYWEGDPTKKIAPDLFVVFRTTKEKRRVWKVWEEGQVPTVVLEFTSRGTQDEDQGSKKGLYEWLGVQEYFLFDPLHSYLKPVLQGFRLEEGGYRRVEAIAGPGGAWQMLSQQLGLWLRVEETALHLYEQATGRKLLAPPELAAALRAPEARIEEEMAARQAAEAELARLRAELERLRRNQQT
ncbi:MAG: hypothetical protein A2147_11105 [Chloroflexi bacterium RBG_16_57_8]|nr:MAG: hypothetical protein A2147_11105 [Chloroflexi bacterium RBG_16_57_8]